MAIVILIQPLPPNTVLLSDILDIPKFPITIPELDTQSELPDCEQEELPY